MTLLQRFEALLPNMLGDITELIGCESPSADLAAIARSAATVVRVGERLLGQAPELVEQDGVSHLRWTWPTTGRRVLVLGHHDTVWPIGTLATHPCEVHDGVLRGPGCFDMKTGVILAMYAIAALPARAGITLLVTGDEELGSRTSRRLIEDAARGCVAALVTEPSGPGGRLKWARSGVAQYEVVARGKAAHAGLDPHSGINSTVEIAHQVLTLSRLGRPEASTTVTPTVIAGGTTGNTVPDEARVYVDVRATSAAEQARVDAAIRALSPALAGSRLEVSGGPNRPPLQVENTRAIFERARALAGEIGIDDLEAIAVGGGSDGNFTGAGGTPTLDGLGAVGGGAHAENEHVLVDRIPARTALLTALLAELLDQPMEVR